MNSAYLLGLVSEKVRTAQVTFEPGGKAYTYLTVLSALKPGQDVIVEVSAKSAILTGGVAVQGKPDLKVATVLSVDEGVEVDPDSSIKFRWIISDLGTTARAKQTELHELESNVLDILRQAEKARRRKKLSKELEDHFGEDALKAVQSLTATRIAPEAFQG